METSTASIVIKPTTAFNHGDTLIFGSWVCTANGAGSFQRYLTMTMTPNPETGLLMLPEVVIDPLVGKFSEISLRNQVANFESRSASNSNSTSPWVIACKTIPLHKHFPYDLCNSSRAHAEALAARRAGKKITSEYSSDSNTVPGYNSDSSYEFDFSLDPIESESELNTTEEPLSGPTAGLVITSTPVGRFIYWPNHKPTNLISDNSRCVTYLETLPDKRGVPDLSVSGDKFDMVEVDPHDLTTTSEPVAPMQSLNQLPMVTNLIGARSYLHAIEKRTRKRCEQSYCHSKVESKLHDGGTIAAVRL
jgi:hypothetical protein